jgi:hypothetical protein
LAPAQPQANLIGDRRDRARVEELDNLRLALATFALQLDAFEMCLCETALRAGIKPGLPVPSGDNGWRIQKGDK